MTKDESELDSDVLYFWDEISRLLDPTYRIEQPIFVLSPQQARRYQLARLGVPKFKHLLLKRNESYKYIIVDQKTFEKNSDEWAGFGLLDKNGLDEKYLNKFPPKYLNADLLWEDLIDSLKEIVSQKLLSERFAKLLAMFLKRNQLMIFLEHFEPYKSSTRSAENNDSSEVERYIFALWMKSHGYTAKKGTKHHLETALAHKIDSILHDNNKASDRPWYFTYYETLLMTKKAESPLIRTVTDMNHRMIESYASDGLLTKSDFPDLFSAT